jgi:hypothetical protein
VSGERIARGDDGERAAALRRRGRGRRRWWRTGRRIRSGRRLLDRLRLRLDALCRRLERDDPRRGELLLPAKTGDVGDAVGMGGCQVALGLPGAR